MAGVMYLGNQMVTPVILKGAEESPYTNLQDGVLTKNFGDASGISFPGIVEVGPAALAYGYENYQLQYGEGDTFLLNGVVSFPDLVKIGQKGLLGCFDFQLLITGCEFPKLEEIGLEGMKYAFAENGGNLGGGKYVFPKLKKIGSSGLEYCFEYIKNSVFIFPSLGTDISQVASNCFSYMLNSGSNNFVYFPSSTEQTIGSWSDVINGLGGFNTTVIFWIPTEISINIAQEGAVLEATDKIYNGVILGTGTTVNYVVYDSTLNKILLGKETGCVENGAPRTVNVDLSTGEYNKITLNINESDSSKISASWNNMAIPLRQESSNVYSFYVNSSTGEQINISVSASGTHASTSAIVTTSGQDIEETIVLPEYEDFIRPNLSSNGTPGGEFFAVKSMYDDGDTEVYKAFDGDNSTYWGLTGNYMYLGFYNPKPIRVSRIVLKCSDSTHVPTRIPAMFDGNDDFWGTQIPVNYTINGNEMTIVPQTTEFYKYQIILGVINAEARITEVEIYGKVPE